ncbi:coil containing protein [Vibrio phage 1.031.O._10N.261.46.F8]|nr:coil containing protein [Vibrio phage 1.031.O._10N.261.46.F8]
MTVQSELVNETQESAEQTRNLPTADELRSSYEGIITTTSERNKELGSMVKVMDLGDTKQMIIDTMTQIQSMSRTKEETAVTRFLRKMPFGNKSIDAVKDAASDTAIESSSVAEVSQKLLDSVTDKRNRVSTIFEKLVDLKNDISESYVQMKAMVDGIDECMDEFDEKERFKMINLKAELLETIEYQKTNIISANGSIKAAEMATTQISQMIPKLRSQVNDSMIIRGSLGELEDLTLLCDTINATCEELRSENMDVMEANLMGILDRSVATDKQLALIDKNASRQAEIQNKIQNKLQNKLQEVSTQRNKVVTRLQTSVNNNEHLLELNK